MKRDISIKLFGLIGKPLNVSPSPKLYNKIFKKYQMNCRYLPFEVAAPYLKNLVTCMKLADLQGLNVTIPFKEKVIPHLDGLDRSARECGAVNTIVRKGNRFYGYNTDGLGFLMALKKCQRFNPKNKTMVILGAGGAARGIAATLAGAGAKKITILNRRLSRARRAAVFLRKKFPRTEWEASPLTFKTNANLVVQTTPAVLRGKGLGFDIRINTKEGRWMLACQAHCNLKLWIRRSIDPAILYRMIGGRG